MNLNISLNADTMDMLEKELGKEAAWTSLRTMMALGTLTSTTPSAKKVVAPVAAPVVAPKQKATPVGASSTKDTWSYAEIGIKANWFVRHKDTGFKYRVDKPWQRGSGLEYVGQDAGFSKYVDPSFIPALKKVHSFTGYVRLLGGSKATANLNKWEVLDENGTPVGRTVLELARLAGHALPSGRSH